jgi:hypothetical protein
LFPADTLTLGPNAHLVDLEHPGLLAFDHALIAQKALERLRGKGAYSTLPTALLAAPFTLGALQRVYEIVLGQPLEASAFRRKIQALDLLEPVSGRQAQRGRPGQLWTLKDGMKTFDKRSLARA